MKKSGKDFCLALDMTAIVFAALTKEKEPEGGLIDSLKNDILFGASTLLGEAAAADHVYKFVERRVQVLHRRNRSRDQITAFRSGGIDALFLC
jgi:hypothetical protein